MKKIATLTILAVATLLAGCNEEEKKLYATPQVEDVGEFDGCTVKFVNRGWRVASFYIAKCGNTTTTTNNYMQSSGKSSTFRRSTTITQEIDKLQVEKSEAEAREQALAKLSPSEKAALGIK